MADEQQVQDEQQEVINDMVSGMEGPQPDVGAPGMAPQLQQPDGGAAMGAQAAQEQGPQIDPNASGNEEVFPGGPTRDQVENWKEQYGQVYMTSFDFATFVWRTLDRFEWKQIMNATQQGQQNRWYQEEQICQMCVLWPEDFNHDAITNGKAGVPALLSEQILNKSGFIANAGAQQL